ncbi:PucR family transcriptional regulator [Actinokineospora bangkokensis]|uniref:PucR C-terminal helix-turn-helix domain-containing protein n=1 Tax=Actinokineospora bangkokensis TaxID=1193682 RepID=A0A1Q9LCZ8_9PSEU|nr:helix-turn-helix domain-containing protein [Actinokineospora bangkokensis]OLR89910.1 hypothetical protein BJP25_02600 [Actinokineospora bangkokensis]
MVDLAPGPEMADVTVYQEFGGVPSDEKVRRELVDRLLEGRFSRRSELDDAARVLELPEDGLFVVLYGDGATDEARPEVSVTAVDPARGRVIVWRSLPEAEIGIVAVEQVSDFEGLRAALAGTGQVIGMSRPVVGLTRVPAALRRARIARRCLAPGDTGVAVFGEHPISTLVAGAPKLAKEVAAEVLSALTELDDGERDDLLGTLRLWYDHGGQAKDVADVLGVHPNTVRYRLRRVQELTERDLDDPRAVAELYLALESARLDP